MAIGAGAAGAWAVNNSTSQTVTLPTHAAGDLLILIAACKAAAITSAAPFVNFPLAGWARLGTFADGTTNAGTGTGSVRQVVWFKVATSSAETSPEIAWGGSQTAAPGIAVALGFTKASGEEWVEPVVLQAATNAATSISVTMGSNPGITAGDWGVIAHTTRDDSALTVPTWTATSTTLGTAVVYPTTPIADGTSNDMAGTAAYRSVTSGTASAAPVVTGTQAAGETGVTCFIRLRVITAPAGTTIYPTDTASAVSTASVDREAWTSRGAGVQTDVVTTVAGPTAPIQITDTAGGTVVDWFTRPLAAFTLGGYVKVNLRGHQGASGANSAWGCEIARVAGDGTSPTVWGTATLLSENSTSQADQPFLVTGSDLAIGDGQRLRIRFFVDDAAGFTMAAGTATLYYAGTSGGASGDTYLTFTQTLTEATAGTSASAELAALTATASAATKSISIRPSIATSTATSYDATATTVGPSARVPPPRSRAYLPLIAQ